MTGIPPLAIAREQKYGNIRCEMDGYHFDSLAEMRHYAGNLKLRLMAGEIDRLTVHPVYPLIVNGLKVGTYKPDFEYRDNASGKVHIEDVKGGNATNTPLSRFKQKCFAAQYGVTVEIITCK